MQLHNVNVITLSDITSFMYSATRGYMESTTQQEEIRYNKTMHHSEKYVIMFPELNSWHIDI